MVRALLIVRYQFDKDEDGDPRTENWGVFDFAALPCAGDLVTVNYEDALQSVIVKKIEHFAIQYPLPEVSFPSLQRREPVQHVIADWHWSD